ncbi:MAG: ABC-type transport auxiliary lipoprotein family protein [Xanthomonadales bacterium]|nr:ABC-type transport auxiliary lipoprotein family protein [Xanthomonadales bacterium]
MIFRPIKVMTLTVAVVLLASCALGVQKESYRLIAPAVKPADARAAGDIRQKLAIARPEADRTRDSSRILVRRGRTLLPWVNAAWIDRAPELLQGLLVEYLDGRVATVGRLGALPAQYRLDLVLRRFELVEGGDELQAELILVARLFAADGTLLGVTVVEGQTAADGHDLDAAVTAMEATIAEVFSALADWLSPRLADAKELSLSDRGQ